MKIKNSVKIFVVMGPQRSLDLSLVGISLCANSRPLVLLYPVDFGEGCSCSSCCGCDRGKTESRVKSLSI